MSATSSIFWLMSHPEIFENPFSFKAWPTRQVDPRIVGCTLTPKSGAKEIHILGVHFSGKGHELDEIAMRLEPTIRPDTVLLGDFNQDLRKKLTKWASPKVAPSLAKLVEQAKRQPNHLATTNKQRSPFQAQVSKMFLQDFSMKDYAFLGERFCETELHGPITRTELLPNPDVPSDHAPLTFDLMFRE